MRLIIVVIFFIPTISSAAIFGANSYEDCMSDGKVGRTGQEMSALQIKCQKEFPKLTKAFRLKDTNLKCVLNTDVISTFKIISNNFFFRDDTPYSIASRTKEKS